jgi:ABC-type Fe3+/spermidine/putrescine transport system ATPase subunit
MSAGRSVAFAGIARSFGAVQALRPTDLAVAAGEFLTLLGPSGSGKTTLLNIAAGYIAPSAGRVLIDDRDVTALPARQRNIGMVFQNYALFPHLTVAGNVAYGLKARGRPADEIARRVADALALVQLSGLGERAIPALSGGQQQRVALARALVIEPDVLLMDEPLGALDRQLRKHVQLEIRRLHREHGRTTIYVTHDQEEALVMSDRIGVMRDGRIAQLGTARELYENPVDTFVASFLGESNLLDGRLVSVNHGYARLEVPGLGVVDGLAADGLDGVVDAAALIRPEDVAIQPVQGGWAARIEEVVYLGDLTALKVRLANGQDIWCRRHARLGVPTGAVTIGWEAAAIRILPLSQTTKTREETS